MKIRDWIALTGFDARRVRRFASRMSRYSREQRRFRELSADAADALPLGRDYPCLWDREEAAGTIDGHYFLQDLWVASRVFANAPLRHIDIGSRIDGFIAHLAVFRAVEVLDIRPLDIKVPNISFLQANVMEPLPPHLRECTDSLSCLHALEHFGLGRYGDPLDPDGHAKGLANITSMLKPGGTLHLSVPIGPSRVEFNAHRVFSVRKVLELLGRELNLVRFSYIADDGVLHHPQEPSEQDIDMSFGCIYGCGMFEARKRNP